MKLAMVLPLFSEHHLREYLGIELIYKALRKNDYHVDRIDLNEKLVDYLLSNKSILHDMFLSKEEKGKVQESPHSKYFVEYLNYILKYDTAKSLKKDGLYDNFFRTVVLHNFDSKIAAGDSLHETYQQILDSTPVINDFLTSVSNELIKGDYNALLMSVPHAHQLIHALLFSKKVKSLDEDITTIFGGSTITLSDDSELEKYVSKGFIDFYIKYSGEDKLLGLLIDLEEKEEIDQTVLIKKEYVDINSQVIDYRPEFDGTSVPVLYSRGCYWGKCSYCNYIFLDSGKFTRKKLPALLSELKQFSGKPVRISLITESLTPHDAKIIAEGILEKNLEIRWGSFIRVNRDFDTSLFSLLLKSGCVYSCVGVESVNDKILNFLNKGYTGEDVYAFFNSAREARFRFFQVNFMYGTPATNLPEVSLPEVNLDDELDNITFISRFRDIIGNIAFFHLEITKKSYLGQNLKELGIEIDQNNSGRSIRVDNIPFVPSLNEKEFMLVERSYGIAGESFKVKDIKVGANLLLRKETKTIPLGDSLIFELNGHFYAGSIKSLILREVTEKLFSVLKLSKELQIEAHHERDLFTLFELGIVDADEVIRNRPKPG